VFAAVRRYARRPSGLKNTVNVIFPCTSCFDCVTAFQTSTNSFRSRALPGLTDWPPLVGSAPRCATFAQQMSLAVRRASTGGKPEEKSQLAGSLRLYPYFFPRPPALFGPRTLSAAGGRLRYIYSWRQTPLLASNRCHGTPTFASLVLSPGSSVKMPSTRALMPSLLLRQAMFPL
jgi:hypothetical protein